MVTNELIKQINSPLEGGARRAGGVNSLLGEGGSKSREVYSDTPGFCKSATLEEVKAQEYKLTPSIYVGTEAEVDDGIPFEEKMEKLEKKLSEQLIRFEQKKTILENLNLL